VCDSVIGTLLNIQGKTNDGLNTRQDLVEMGICDQLHPRFDGKKIYLSPTCHTFVKKREDKFLSVSMSCQSVIGYSSNMKSLVQLKDLFSAIYR